MPALGVVTALVASVAGPVGAAPTSAPAVLPAPIDRAGAHAPPALGAPLARYTPPPGSPYPARPGPLTGLRVAAVTPTSITLAWDPVVPGGTLIRGHTITYSRAFDDVIRLNQIGNVTTATITTMT